MQKEKFPKLILPDGFDERWESEIADRGYFSEALVETSETRCYSVFFIVPVRLQQELADTSQKLGQKWFAEPGLIVLEDINLDKMQEAIEGLYRDGFFSHLKSVSVKV